MTTPNDHDSSHLQRAAVGGDEGCDHPTDARSYLGNMGSAAFYQCTVCGGAVIVW